jgi:hypothetical protein
MIIGRKKRIANHIAVRPNASNVRQLSLREKSDVFTPVCVAIFLIIANCMGDCFDPRGITFRSGSHNDSRPINGHCNQWGSIILEYSYPNILLFDKESL